MTPICTKEMEPLTRGRYHFALSAFSRMYGVSGITQEMSDLCFSWALGEEVAPLDCLNHVDRYFRKKWDTLHAGY